MAVDRSQALVSTLYGYLPQEQQYESLLERLRVICSTRDVPFLLHEVCMRATGGSGQAVVNSDVRVRCITEDAQLWTIRHLAQARPSQADTRILSDLQVSSNAESWLIQLGYTFYFEYVKDGLRFAAVLPPTAEQPVLIINIFVTKVKKFKEKGNFSTLVDLSPGYLVELQCEEEPSTKELGARLVAFAKTLSPLVEFLPDSHMPK